MTGTEPVRLCIGKIPVAFVASPYTKTALTKSHGLINFGSAVAHVIKPGSPKM
jgi:hypothetical protein